MGYFKTGILNTDGMEDHVTRSSDSENKEMTSEFLTENAITSFFLCEEGMKKFSKWGDDINKSKEES